MGEVEEEDDGRGRIREEDIKRSRGDGEDIVQEVIERIREKEAKERRKKIEESNYNKEYKKIWKEKRPEYLSWRMKMTDRRMIARFRCGNEIREREYCKEEEEKICKICKKEKESLWHMLKEYEETRQEEEIEVVLGGEGQGLRTLREIVKKRTEWEEKIEK